MKLGARRTLIRTAERKGVPWRDRAVELSALIPEADRESRLGSVRDSTLQYPPYYLNPFHAYDTGNLGWLQAFEAGSATRCMAMRVYSKQSPHLSPADAFDEMQGSYFAAVVRAAPPAWVDRPRFSAVDVGCGVGISTRDNARRLLARGVDVARVEGLDASPYFITVAAEDTLPAGCDTTDVENLVAFRHALGERTGLCDASVDWFSLQLMAHELPAYATREIMNEAFRVLKPQSVFSLFDNDPMSRELQNLSPVLFTLMKSTEPFLDQFYTLDLVHELEQIGFVNVSLSQTDPRHRTIVATKP